jgi:opacity protein-like surface antigen
MPLTMDKTNVEEKTGRPECRMRCGTTAVFFLLFLFSAGPLLSSARISLQDEPQSASAGRYSRFKFTLRALYSIPHEPSVRNLYDSRLMGEGELAVRVLGPASVWISGDFYSGRGVLPQTQEATRIRLVSAAGGLMIRSHKGRVHPYLAGGVTWLFFDESNSIGQAEGDGFGWLARTGLDISFTRNLALDVSASYTQCFVQPQRLRVNLGSLRTGFGLSLTF